MKRETWLITGGAGFIGAATVRGLLRLRRKVIVFDNFSASTPAALEEFGAQITVVKGDVCDYKALLAAAQKADILLHLAAVKNADAELTFKTNIGGALNALKAAENSKVRKIILASDAAVYGNKPPPHHEDGPVAPCTPYAVSKLRAEELCLDYHYSRGATCVLLRFFNVYGPGYDDGIISKFIQCAAQPAIRAAEKQTRDFVFIDDIVKSVLWAGTVHARAGKIYNVGTGAATSLRQLADMLQKLTGKKLRVNFKPAGKEEIKHSRADIARISAYRFRYDYTLEEGLKKMLGMPAQKRPVVITSRRPSDMLEVRRDIQEVFKGLEARPDAPRPPKKVKKPSFLDELADLLQ